MDRAAADRFVELAFDFLCARRVGEFTDADRVLAVIDAAGEPSRVARFIQRFVAPSRNRLLAAAKASALKLAVFIPEPARDLIAAELGKPAPLPRRLVEEMVASDRVREGVRAMVQETVNGTVERILAVTPGGSGRGLFGVIGVGARVAGAAGRGLFGGIANDVIDSGVALVQRRLVERLTSDDTARQLGARRRAVFLQLLDTPEAKAGRFLERAPHLLFDGLAPVLIAHNLQRPEFRAVLRAEIEATLAELSAQTIGELLDELGQRALLLDGLRSHVSPLVQNFADSVAFADFKRSL